MNINSEIKDCYSKSIKISGKYIYVFEKHNMALHIWGKFADLLRTPVNLITFDTHTDTQPALSSYAANNMISKSNVQNILQKPNLRIGEKFCPEYLFDFAKTKVGNADHIETAICLGFLSSYIVVHRDDKFIINNTKFEDLNAENRMFFHRDNIDWNVLHNIQDPLVLDFDLDYFHSLSEMDRNFEKQIAPLIRRAEVITIALEPDYFEFHKQDNSNFTSDLAFSKLIKIIKYALK